MISATTKIMNIIEEISFEYEAYIDTDETYREHIYRGQFRRAERITNQTPYMIKRAGLLLALLGS